MAQENVGIASTRQRHWRGCIGVSLGCLTLGLAWSLLSLLWTAILLPSLLGPEDSWYAPADAWHVVSAARWVANGAALFMYETNVEPQYTYGPVWAVLMAPAIAIGDHLELVYSHRYKIPKPTMMIPMLLIGVTAVIGVYSAAAWRCTKGLGRFARRKAVVAAAVPAFVAVGIWFHGEDVLLAAFALLAVTNAAAAPYWLAAALLTKQTALAYAPALFAACEPSRRMRFLIIAVGVPSAVMSIFFTATPTSVTKAVQGLAPCSECYTPSLWSGLFWDDDAVVSAAPSRILWILTSAWVAYLWREKCRQREGLITVLTVIALMRCLLYEPGVYGYYWFTPMSLALLSAALTGRRMWPLLLGFAAIMAWHSAGIHLPLALWWSATAVAAAVLWGPQLSSLGPPQAKRTSPARQARTGSQSVSFETSTSA